MSAFEIYEILEIALTGAALVILVIQLVQRQRGEYSTVLNQVFWLLLGTSFIFSALTASATWVMILWFVAAAACYAASFARGPAGK